MKYKQIIIIVTRFVAITLIIFLLLVICSAFVAYPDRYRAEFYAPMTLNEIKDRIGLFLTTSMIIGAFVTILYTSIKNKPE